MPPEVLGLKVGVAQHARQAGGQYPPPGPLGRVRDIRGYDIWSRLSSQSMAGHSPGSAWSQRTQGGFGSGGATLTPASSAISRANTSA